MNFHTKTLQPFSVPLCVLLLGAVAFTTFINISIQKKQSVSLSAIIIASNNLLAFASSNLGDLEKDSNQVSNVENYSLEVERTIKQVRVAFDGKKDVKNSQKTNSKKAKITQKATLLIDRPQIVSNDLKDTHNLVVNKADSEINDDLPSRFNHYGFKLEKIKLGFNTQWGKHLEEFSKKQKNQIEKKGEVIVQKTGVTPEADSLFRNTDKNENDQRNMLISSIDEDFNTTRQALEEKNDFKNVNIHYERTQSEYENQKKQIAEIWDEYSLEKIVDDKVETKMSSTSEHIPVRESEKMTNNNEELPTVNYGEVLASVDQLDKDDEYSYKKIEVNTQVEDKSELVYLPLGNKHATLSGRVVSTIEREMKSLENKNLGHFGKNNKTMYIANADNGYLKQKRKINSKEKENNKSSFLNDGQTSSVIRVKAGILGESIEEGVTQFEFRPLYNINMSISDEGSGSIKIIENLNSNSGVYSGTIVRNEFLPTNVDLHVKANENEFVNQFDVVLVTRNSIESFFNERNLEDTGGHILVKLNNITDDIEIDKMANAKIYLDENLKEVDRIDDYTYILFIGVEPGNVLLSYKIGQNHFSSKVINIVEEELYYDHNSFYSLKEKSILLLERDILGQADRPLDIKGEHLTVFNTGEHLEKRGLNQNRYEIMDSLIPTGSRAYLEIKNIEQPVYIGMWPDNQNIETSSTVYLGQILNLHGIQDLENRCFTQINLTRPISNIIVEGRGSNNSLFIAKSFLEKNGTLSEEMTLETEKVFLIGEEQGAISAKIEYVDGKVDHLLSYCSLDTYLIEQL